MNKVDITEGVVLLKNAVETSHLRSLIEQISAQAPFRQMAIKGGKLMSAQMTNCGTLGWTSSEGGYRYTTHDPIGGNAWPTMPDAFRELAINCAAQAGFEDFDPDGCLINRYSAQAQMGSHQDRDEHDLRQPIVSVSIGCDAVFKLGGLQRSDPMQKLLLSDGDVLVWGGVSRLRFHSVGSPLASMTESVQERFNLTFRRVR
jgi:DNA oxidative demethylase